MIPIEYFSNFSIDKKPEFIKKFIFNPLFESYYFIKNYEEIKKYNENEITKEIYKYIKYSSSISKEIQKHIIVIGYRPKEIKDNKETEPDLQFIIPNCFRIFFETKRIYKKDSCSEYCGKNGLGRFLSGYYSFEDIDGGMIAYVQKGNQSEIQNKTIGKIQQIECIDLNRYDLIFQSIHERKGNKNIKIYHIFFDFTNYN